MIEGKEGVLDSMEDEGIHQDEEDEATYKGNFSWPPFFRWCNGALALGSFTGHVLLNCKSTVSTLI